VHATAKKCVQWSIALFLVGALLMVFGPRIFVQLSDLAGANAAVGLDLADVTLTLVRLTTMPVGAALIGAAVVIQVLAPSEVRSNQ